MKSLKGDAIVTNGKNSVPFIPQADLSYPFFFCFFVFFCFFLNKQTVYLYVL